MPWAVAGAAIAAGGAIAGGAMQANAASTAAGAQTAAENSALGFQNMVYQQGQGNLQPYITTGQNALSSLGSFFGLPGSNGNAQTAFNQFTQTPYYTFPLQQGIASMDASGAARGLELSGGQMNSLQAYGQNYASGFMGNYISALSSLAGMGQNAAGTLMGQANTAAQTGAGIQQNIGNAGAAGTMGGANALTGAINNVTGILGNGQAGNAGLLSNTSFQGLFGTGSSYNSPGQTALLGAMNSNAASQGS